MNNYSARHNKPHSELHCRVLPPGEFNSMIADSLPVYSENFMMIVVG